MRHLKPLWEVHRHRMAPQVATVLKAELAQHQVELVRGRIKSVEAKHDLIQVVYQEPHLQTQSRTYDVVINCTGPQSPGPGQGRLLTQRLFERGLIQQDFTHLGIQLDSAGHPLGPNPEPPETLWYLGPWLKARDWEATAVPELNSQAKTLAKSLLEALSLSRQSSRAHDSIAF
jgi:uncharacterized NAD(P)/FAD-binding protein YdhS